MEKSEMGGSCSTYGEDERRVQDFGTRNWEKKPRGRRRSRGSIILK